MTPAHNPPSRPPLYPSRRRAVKHYSALVAELEAEKLTEVEKILLATWDDR
jgi:hypothetical protein